MLLFVPVIQIKNYQIKKTEQFNLLLIISKRMFTTLCLKMHIMTFFFSLTVPQ